MKEETLKRDLCARLMEGVMMVNKEVNKTFFNPLILKGFRDEDSIYLHGLSLPQKLSNYAPILFPTSALTKPIQIASYNNGEPFVPLVEMARILGWNIQKCLLNSNTESFGIMCNSSLRLMDEDVQDVLAFTINEGFGWHSRPSKEFHVVLKQPELYDLMHKFHINYRLSPDQFIEVTNEFNPYK